MNHPSTNLVAVGRRELTPEDLPAPSLAWVSNLAEGFARSVELFGDRTALRGLSYRDLDNRVAELAGVLQTCGGGGPVAILLERSADLVVAALAANRTGAAYMLVDPGTPVAPDSALVITSTGLADRVPAGLPALALDEPLPSAAPLPADACPSTWDSLAYLTFPAGVPVTHGNLLGLFTSAEDRYAFGPGDVWPFSEVSVWGALLHGGCLDVESGVQLMCALFEEVLGMSGVRPDDSFFTLGGDSVIALRLRTAALTRGIPIDLCDLYTAQTPRALAARLPTEPAAFPDPFTPAGRQPH